MIFSYCLTIYTSYRYNNYDYFTQYNEQINKIFEFINAYDKLV